MIKLCLTILNLIVLSSYLFAQNNLPFTPARSEDIQYIDISASELFPQIKKFILEKTDSSALFKGGYGYVVVESIRFRDYRTQRINSLSALGDRKNADTMMTYTIHLASYALLDRVEAIAFNGDYYPPFYTFVENRLVLLYDETFRWLKGGRADAFSAASKEKLRELIRPLLIKALEEDFVFFHPLDPRLHFTLSKKQRATMSEEEILINVALTLDGVWFISKLTNGEVLIDKPRAYIVQTF